MNNTIIIFSSPTNSLQTGEMISLPVIATVITIYIILMFYFPLKTIYSDSGLKVKNRAILFKSLIKSSLVGIIGLPIIFLIKTDLPSAFGSLFILYASLLVFSLESYFSNKEKIQQKKEDKNNEKNQKRKLLTALLNSLKSEYKYDYKFLKDYDPNSIDSEYENVEFHPIITEGLYNDLMKKGYEPEIMEYIVYIYKHGNNIVQSNNFLKKNYNKLHENNGEDKIKEAKLELFMSYCFYYINIFEFDEKYNKTTNTINALIGDILDNKSKKECLKIIKNQKILKKLKEYDTDGKLSHLN